MEFIKKYGNGKDMNVMVTSKTPYSHDNDDRNIYCVIYFINTKTKRRLFRKPLVTSTKHTLSYNVMRIKDAHEWKRKDFEVWVDRVVDNYNRQAIETKKGNDVKKLIDSD